MDLRPGLVGILFLTSLGVEPCQAYPGDPSTKPPFRLSLGAAAAEWSLVQPRRQAWLTVAGPDGHLERHSLAERFSLSLYDASGTPRPNGIYTWELFLAPDITGGVEPALSGSFQILDGSFVPPGRREILRKEGDVSHDQVVGDDLIVSGSLCVGLDCVAGESFGTDNLRLKANVLRLKLDDTSSGGGFPANDWQITANDSGSGGLDKLSLEDVTAGTTPFTLQAGAPNHSLYIGPTGKVGVRTSIPAADLHVLSSNTPALRLEQSVAGGLPAQSWELAGGSNGVFSVRDLTAAADGSRQPLHIQPGAPTSSVAVAANGFVGFGTATPAAQLHLFGTDAGGFSNKILVENANTGPAAPRELYELRNHGDVAFIVDDTTDPERWSFGTFSHNFLINNQANPALEYSFGPTGNLTISGTLTQNSDRETKTEIVAVEPAEVLAKVVELPIATWRLKTDPPAVRHLGPMAQDFAAAFGLGTDDKHIAPADLAGAGLAAIQALWTELQELKEENEALARELRALRESIGKEPR